MNQLPLLLGQIDLTNTTQQLILVIVGVVVVFGLGLLFLFVNNYRRCPSNRILVVYGAYTGDKGSIPIHGGAQLVIPLFQDSAYLSLEPIQIEVPLRGALSSENIRVNVPSVFTVAIGTQEELMQNAAQRLLGLSTQEVRKQAEELIFGQLRQVIASMKIEDINRNRESFLHHIQESLEPELAKIGLVLINVNITDITDESGYIDAIGQKAASEAIQKARGDVAENERMGETNVANANRDQSIQVAAARKEMSIGTRSAERDQAVRLAEMEKEQTIAERTAAFQREAEVKNSERQMRISVAEADASAINGENVSQAAIAKSQAELAVRRAEAFQIGESKKREAQAAVLEVENRALAKAALAQADRVEAEKRAEFEAPAKAQKAKMIVEAEADAERVRIAARAQADAIFAKLDAEARGNYEILAKKGEGLQRIVEACGGSQPAFQLLMLEHLDKLAETSATAISNIKFDKVVVWEGGGTNGDQSSTASFLQGMGRSLPPMMHVLKDIAGIEFPESLIKIKDNPVAESGNGASA